MNDRELLILLNDLESDRVERKASNSDPKKLRQAICAFANDLPNHQKPGVLFIGINDDGTFADFDVTDKVLVSLENMRSDGKILPFPTMIVRKLPVGDCTLAVIVVEPSDSPPIRYDGRTWVRVGPRRALASAEEERRLNEKRRFKDQPFDLRPFVSASLDDLDLSLFQQNYLSSAIAPDVLEENNRPLSQQLASVRLTTPPPESHPTTLGLLVIGNEPRGFIPGAYIQFVRFDGVETTAPIRDQKELTGSLFDILQRLDDLLQINISIATDITAQPIEIQHPDYPIIALQQLARNAVMHRSYESTNAPVRIYWFRDRIEIQNPGGLFGQVTEQSLGKGMVTDYR
ncbi:MAG: transcriptional regulator, partial [Merismopedia sp. SIO2A8]|nr:transcriptional regulator [Merismopedia sp. SIO2A8]